MTVGGAEISGPGIYWRSEGGDSRSLLVGITRGRDANFVIGKAGSVDDLRAELVGQLSRDRADVSPRAALRHNGRETPRAQLPDPAVIYRP